MLTAILATFSLSGWFFDVWAELVRYFNTLNTLQYSILAACAVAFGFMCLKGTRFDR